MFVYLIDDAGHIRPAEYDLDVCLGVGPVVSLAEAMNHPVDYWPVRTDFEEIDGFHLEDWAQVWPCPKCGYAGACIACKSGGFEAVTIERRWMQAQIELALEHDDLMRVLFTDVGSEKAKRCRARIALALASHLYNNAAQVWLLEAWRREEGLAV